MEIFRFKQLAKQIPGLKTVYHGARNTAIYMQDYKNLIQLRLNSRLPFQADSSSNTIVSLTSFPARIQHAWISIETIFQQRRRPAKVVLVLAEEEFPNRVLPQTIRKQEQRGLEILWTARNMRSYKKLIPTRAAYPDATIITIDDDVYYEPWRLERLILAANQNPGAIIGHRGWEISVSDGELLPYINWPPANTFTPEGRILLTGCGGILYPPHSLSDEHLIDYYLAEILCPLADDIWFWIAAKIAGTRNICLGNNYINVVRSQKNSPSLASINWLQGHNDNQLKNVIQFFKINDWIFD
jgi:hypothetical protein